jgi:hypothetical protein
MGPPRVINALSRPLPVGNSLRFLDHNRYADLPVRSTKPASAGFVSYITSSGAILWDYVRNSKPLIQGHRA